MSDKTYTFTDADGSAYTRTRVRPSEVQAIRDRNAAFTAQAETIRTAADGRDLSEKEQKQISIEARYAAVFGPHCPQVNFYELDSREINLFAEAFWSHINGVTVSPN